MRFARFVAALMLALAAQASSAAPVSRADRAEVIGNAAHLLETRYVDAEAGARLAGELRRTAGQWDAISDPAAFARAVTEWLRTRSGDGHLGLSYSVAAIGRAATRPRSRLRKWSAGTARG